MGNCRISCYKLKKKWSPLFSNMPSFLPKIFLLLMLLFENPWIPYREWLSTILKKQPPLSTNSPIYSSNLCCISQTFPYTQPSGSSSFQVNHFISIQTAISDITFLCKKKRCKKILRTTKNFSGADKLIFAKLLSCNLFNSFS